MISGVVALLCVGRLPLWIILVVVIRDLFLLSAGGFILFRYKVRVPVVYAGKVATTFLFVGFAGLLLNFPMVSGLGVCDLWWLPGFNGDPVSWGIWFVYAGLVLALITTAIYAARGWKGMRAAQLKAAESE